MSKAVLSRVLAFAAAWGALLALSPSAALALSQSQFASSWVVNNDADWTPYPSHANGANPLGAPNDFCTGSGGAGAGPWADWSFPAFSIPGAEAITGIEVRFKYYATGIEGSPNTAQLKLSGAFVGATREIPPYNAGMNACNNTVFQSAGGAGDTWGAGLTAADFNAGNVSVRLTKGSPTLDLDAVELIVYFGNSAPTAEAGGPYNVGEGGSVGLDGSGSSDPDQAANTLTYVWDLDADTVFGEAGETGSTPTFSAAGLDGPTSRVVTLRVTDGDGVSDEDTATVNVSNVPPAVATPSVTPEPSDEGEAVTASATFVDPGPDTFTCTVDYGDGGGAQAGSVVGNTCNGPSHAYGDDGTYTVTVAVTDDDGGSDSGSTSHEVENVPPSVANPIVTPEPSDEGEAVTASATFVDPGPDGFTCTVDYGDGGGAVAGAVVGNTCNGPSHSYGDDGTYTVTVAVSDDDGGADSASASHEVENVPPAVAAPTVSPEPSDEGSAVTASATFTDAGASDGPFTCTVDYGDGSGAAAGTVSNDDTCTGPPHTYADDGSYTVTVAVTDKDGGTGSAGSAHQVDNVDPTITVSTNSAEGCGDTADGGLVEVSADFTDPGFDSAVAGTVEDFDDSTIDWGDGTVEAATVDETPGSAGTPTTGTISGSHTYASGGIYTVTLTVADDDGGSDSVTVDVFVTGAGLNAGQLQVVGTDFKDVVNLQVKGDEIEVHAGFLGKPGKLAFPEGAVSSLRVAVCDGDDQVHVGHDVDVGAWLEGGDGRDHLRAGSGPAVIEGGADDDVLEGGAAPDLISGGAGDDVLHGRGGDDQLFGEDGDDGLHGNAGDDTLDGGAGADDCHGEPGSDTIGGCEP